jgi:ferredoxin-type protein NapF
LSKVDSSRRAFLRGALLTREGRAAEAARQQPLGPTPPWHQGLALDETCPDCAHPCVTACEPVIIRMHPADHELAGTPYLDFGISGCTFCKACVMACPMEIEVIESVKPRIGKARLNRDTCIAWDDVICMSCFGRCDYQAITTVHQRRAQIDNERCNGCGMCVAVCPVGALSIG